MWCRDYTPSLKVQDSIWKRRRKDVRAKVVNKLKESVFSRSNNGRCTYVHIDIVIACIRPEQTLDITEERKTHNVLLLDKKLFSVNSL